MATKKTNNETLMTNQSIVNATLLDDNFHDIWNMKRIVDRHLQ